MVGRGKVIGMLLGVGMGWWEGGGRLLGGGVVGGRDVVWAGAVVRRVSGKEVRGCWGGGSGKEGGDFG